jgi:NAD(P)-dependent dehydrogenase (short-subunit alcohol dehydrogenase family)
MAKWTIADIPSQQGRLAVVTGANSGIGWHTALELARAGGEVILTARTAAKGSDAVQRIKQVIPQARVRFELLDLASLRSVRVFAAKVGQEAKLDLLVNNAGVMAIPQRQVTEDGFEMQFGTNYLGPFALIGLLMPVLRRGAAPRVTTVSSGAANMGLRRINFEDLQWERGYGPWKAYCQSKLADLMLMTELGRRYTGVVSTAAHPGYARTNLQTSGPGVSPNTLRKLAEKALEGVMSQDAAAGALPTLRAATEMAAGSGSYFGPDRVFQMNGDPVRIALPKPAVDDVAAVRLWEVAERLTGVVWGDF